MHTILVLSCISFAVDVDEMGESKLEDIIIFVYVLAADTFGCSINIHVMYGISIA